MWRRPRPRDPHAREFYEPDSSYEPDSFYEPCAAYESCDLTESYEPGESCDTNDSHEPDESCDLNEFYEPGGPGQCKLTTSCTRWSTRAAHFALGIKAVVAPAEEDSVSG
ncbi:hypothetical protein [Mycobacterium sp. 852002-40037_SCH5390672]|uniref:hypothetical protein n=1 Tax=Mycobacterium sp. 852002-40037_SCH5390672 TaxID=1834089 RepID=UPI000804A3BB|nr:hypothetical protein [Mycobacterium sp. 852002-40037_SCH5390672]OBB94660.1 hypothetical protein A5782_09155 [Mycobacterium sp. 852002-40037_SCH5390672]